MTETKKVRADKWLWAARFFKTRSQATQAVNGGKVHLNGARFKPSHSVSINDELRIQKGPYEFVVIVKGLLEKRVSAPLAQELYEETGESIAAREESREKRRLIRGANVMPEKRPSKRDRRLIKKFIRKGE